jgi:hypothetical protein
LEDVIGIDELFSQREEGIKEMIKKAEKQPWCLKNKKS